MVRHTPTSTRRAPRNLSMANGHFVSAPAAPNCLRPLKQTGWDLGPISTARHISDSPARASIRSLSPRLRGVLINAPYRIRIPKELLKEQNTLEVAVSNLMTNRIIDLDRRGVNWKKFYNTNMPARRRENAGPDGLFTAAGWTRRESGLIGPVALIPLERFSPGSDTR